MASAFLTESLAAVERIAKGNATDPAVLADIATLKTSLTENASSDAETKVEVGEIETVVTAILNKLAAAPAPTTDGEPIADSVADSVADSAPDAAA